jgi:SAM-dependent methyltransferase
MTYLDRDASGYEKGVARWTRQLAVPFLDVVGLAPGERILDLGCGTGSLAKEVLRRLEGGEVHGCDPSPSSVAVLRSQIKDARLRLHVSDANRLPLPDGSVDRALSLFVLNFAGPGAIAEKARVVRAGGWIAAGVADFRDTDLMIRRLYDLGGAATPDAARLRQEILGAPMCNPLRAAAECRRQGLEAVETVTLSVSVRYENFADCWSTLAVAQGPNGTILACLSRAARAAVEQQLRVAYLAGAADGPRRETIAIWALKARRPAR